VITDDHARSLRNKVHVARGILGDALDRMQSALTMLDEVSTELEEANLAALQARLDDIAARAKSGAPADEGPPGAPPTIGDAPPASTRVAGHAVHDECPMDLGVGLPSGTEVRVLFVDQQDPGDDGPHILKAIGNGATRPAASDPSSAPPAFALTPPQPPAAPVKEKKERPAKPMPADWAPKSATRIKLASLGIDAGPTSSTVKAYREAMSGQVRKAWADTEFVTWAKARQRASMVAAPTGAVA
jgi:hypothetical protein